MQNKIIAATIASSAAALQLQSPAPTMLAQDLSYEECHGTYAYQCIEQKVDHALGEMVKDVDNRKQECILTAEDMREDIVEEAQNTRYTLERQLEEMRYTAAEAIKDRMQAAKQTVEDAVDQAIQDMCDQLDAYKADTHPAAVERHRVEGEIKKVYYGGIGGQYSAYELKDKIAVKVDAFNEWLAANYPKNGFGEYEIARLQDTINTEVGALNALIASSTQAWNAALEQAAADMNTLILDRTAALEARISEKTQLMNDVIADLAENFIVIYWDTVEEIYKSVNYYERQGLVWKALYQKDAFLAEVGGIRDWLVQGLADVRSQMVAELNVERDGFAGWRATQRGLFSESTQTTSANMQRVVDTGLDRTGQTQAEKGELVPAQDEKLEKFVYELSELQQAPKGHGNEHSNGYQPYAKWVSNRITDNIDVFGVAALEAFDAASLAAVDSLMATLASEKAALSADNINAQTKLDATTASLIDDLVNSRQQIEAGLGDWQDVQEEGDEAARDIDQIALITTKNTTWKELSWIIRQAHAGYNAKSGVHTGGHEHGYSAGPVFAYVGVHAQIADKKKPFDKDYVDPFYQSIAVDDGYDPYGYGDYGYGYGHAQTQFKEIQEKLQVMEAAIETIFAKNEKRIADSEAALAVTQQVAWTRFEDALATKWASLSAAIETQNIAWENTVASRSATVAAALDLAKTTIYTAKEVMVAALDASEKEIRWAITSVYNYDTQDALNVALTEARAEIDAVCDARIESLRLTLEDVRSTWELCVVRETDSLNANTEEEQARCEAAKSANTQLLEAFKQAQRDRFAAWAANERRELEAFVGACQEAWEWIKVSYCLKHGEKDDIVGAGHGCSWGQGSGYGNGGFKKGVAIEEHDEILSYGQEIDIKHIHHEQKLIQHAVDFTMEGVPEEDAKQQALVDVRQAEIEAEVRAARAALEAALTQRLTDSTTSLDATVARLAAELLAREDNAIAGVESTRLGWQTAVDELREKLLWDIKEIVWRLGYTQGYHYGAHDGHDEDLLAQIAAKKDEYEALIILTLQEMENRVRLEQEAGDAATQAARYELDAEQERLLREMNEAITQALADMETVLAVAKQNMTDEIQRARDALYAFIDARLAEWGQKAHYEDINAKWQEDSYYRYNLLRLLAAKQAAVDAAVAAAKKSFNDAMAEENQEGVDFRAAMRTAFTEFTNVTRQALVDAINQDDVEMEAIIDTRTASLDKRLGDQQAALVAALNADREEMRLQLKEVYSYNSYEYNDAEVSGNVGAYSHEQHQSFLHKFSYYLKDVLRGMDAGIAAMVADYNTSIANHTESAQDENEVHQYTIGDQRADSEKSCSRHAENLLELFNDTQAAELGVLRSHRDAAEEEMRSKALGLKKDIIYAMHVIRYAGGKDLGSFGFGQGASSFHGKGNSLTGIDELDLWRAPTRLGYAQVQDGNLQTSINKDDHHHVQLQEMLADAKTGFDVMIQACRDDFAAHVETEKAEATGRMDALNAEMLQLTTDAAAALAQTSADSVAAFAASNQLRWDALYEQTTNAANGFVAVVDAQLERTTGWFNDKLEWVEKLYDSAYKTHIVNELTAKKNGTTESLNRRRTQALDEAEAARQRLADAFAAEASDLAAFIASEAAGFAHFVEALLAATAERGAEINLQYAVDADAELAAKNATADAVTRDWAFWLKYLYGFQGYETSIYLSYDDTADYSSGLGPKSFGGDSHDASSLDYAAGTGAYLDLGLQGVASNQGGYPHLSGFGYGGAGGHDYIDSGDATGLAYGTEIGPNKDFFTGSVLDRLEDHDLHQMLGQYAASYAGLQF